MGTFYQRVDLYRRNTDGTFPTTPTATIEDAYNFAIPKGTAKVKDVFSFNLINANNKYFNGESTFRIGDMVKIYMWKDTASPNSTTDLIMDGLITQPNETINDKGKVIEIKGVSRIEYLFSTIIPVSLQQKTLPIIIKNILDKVIENNKLGNTGFGIKYVYLGYEYSPENPGGVPTSHANTISNVMTDGVTAFTATWDASANYEQATAMLEKYSSTDFTQDPDNAFPYIYYLDNQNYFWWIPRSTSVSSTYKIEEGVNATELKCKWEDDVYNALILNCGVGPNGRGITTFVANYTSVTRYGVRWKYVSTTSSYAESLMNYDSAVNPSSFLAGDRFPIAYNYTTAWNAKKSYASAPVMTKDSPIVISSDEEYLTAIRRTSQDMAREWGNAYLEKQKGAKLVIQSEFSKDNNFAIASLYNHVIPSYDLAGSGQNLRLVQLSNSFWNTNPDSEEDVESKARS